jgi:LmbE family N-acetylglucosaminyl deacetylase
VHSLEPSSQQPLSVLAIGAHCDDIEIGCGGSLLRLISENRIARIHWIVFASTPLRKKEAIHGARLFLKGLSETNIEVLDFPDTQLPLHAIAIKDRLFQLREEFNPDLIFTHYREDLHQDHKLLAELCGNVFRNHLILEYEIPKYDGDLGQPNYFIHLEAGLVARKIQFLQEAYISQRSKHWFDEETFKALLRIRGLESAAPNRYAEAFHLRKGVLTF